MRRPSLAWVLAVCVCGLLAPAQAAPLKIKDIRLLPSSLAQTGTIGMVALVSPGPQQKLIDERPAHKNVPLASGPGRELPDSFDVEVSCENDGSHGPVVLSVVAKSRDGATRRWLTSASPVKLPESQYVKVIVRVAGPRLWRDMRVDSVVVRLESQREPPVHRSVAYEHTWRADKAVPAPNEPPNYYGHYRLRFEGSFEEDDFALMDTMLASYATPRREPGEGEALLKAYEDGLQAIFTGNAKWTRQHSLAQIDKWHAANPRSAGAALARAVYWRTYAHALLGKPDKRDVDPFARKMYAQYLGRAEQQLRQTQAIAGRNPLWYLLSLRVNAELGRPPKVVERAFSQGVARFPRLEDLYSAMADYWVTGRTRPEWERADKVVQTAVANTRQFQGSAAYAKLYRELDVRLPRGFSLFEDSPATWPLMRQGLKDWVAVAPGGPVENIAAGYACLMGDRAAFQDWWPQARDRLDPDAWPEHLTPEKCHSRLLDSPAPERKI